MKITTTLPDTAPRVWRPSQVRILAHEFGVAVAPGPTQNLEGRRVRRLVNDGRASGHGPVTPLAKLRRQLAYQWFDVWRAREQRAVLPLVDVQLCELLNEPDNGLLVVPLAKCRCGRAA